MIPDISKITIQDNKNKIIEFLNELIIAPRINLHKWSKLTNQTPAIKIGYIGQHLASLITGIPGTGSGARGDDLIDHSEVKSCNKIDQVDKCKKCNSRVLRFQSHCPICGSTNINRKNDSKWLFFPRSQAELDQYINLSRLILILMDYPNFTKYDFSDIRISAFEIYPREDRMSSFKELITNYYNNIYLTKHDDSGKTNPMNLHPLSFQFYKCNPIKTFECIIYNIDSLSPNIVINHYVEPSVERGLNMPSINMPSHILSTNPKNNEWENLIKKCDYDTEILPRLGTSISYTDFISLSTKEQQKLLPYLDETLKAKVPLRKIVALRQKVTYSR